MWQEMKGLAKLPMSVKLAVTTFLLVAGLGYLLGFSNIYLTYNLVDSQPGLSIDDIRIAFNGSQDGSKLEKALGGAMKQYLESDQEGATLVTWIKGGHTEATFKDAKVVFENSCITCHSNDVKTAGVSLEAYQDVLPLLAVDTGKSISRLVELSHVHLMGALPLVFLLCLVFSFTLFGEKLKGTIMVVSLLALVFDVGSWWLAKAWGGLAFTVMAAGMTLALAFLVLILLSLYDLWLRKDVAP